jgi:LuxR family transcriptional regulator, maltose regulon positive regulatory protein
MTHEISRDWIYHVYDKHKVRKLAIATPGLNRNLRMQNSDPLLGTKIHLPSTRPNLVPRPRLREKILQGLRGPLTLIIAPAGFGKTTLVAACIVGCGMPVAWLSLDAADNDVGRFLKYLIAALRELDSTIGGESARLLAAPQQAPPEAILTGLINDLDVAQKEIILVLDDYHFISSQTVHEQMTFLLEHCPNTLHLVVATRSDPPLLLPRLRARNKTVELRSADLRFTELEAAQFLNDVMGLHLDSSSIAVLEERTEGWIAGLQMAALSMRDREDVPGFIKGFSGTNRYILDYLLEEVLAGQSLEIQRFLLCTSILDRLTAALCDAILVNDEGSKTGNDVRSTGLAALSLHGSAFILEYMERANLFLVPLDDERQWYRYHHLFADLLQTQLQKSLGDNNVARYHLRASEWYEQNGMPIDAIRHASLASDSERIERLIEQNYLVMLNRGEMSGIRSWMGKLNKELVTRRPWLCLYEAFSCSWFGQLEEATLLLNEAEKRIRCEISKPDVSAMIGYHAFVKSRVTAMEGDTQQAIEFCLIAHKNLPVDNIGLQIEIGITLGYEYFLSGDFINASKTLHKMIRSANTVRAINNPVAAYAILARVYALQGLLHDASDLFQKAAQLIPKTDGQYQGALGLVEVGVAALLCEWNDVQTALVRVKQGLDFLPSWGKADDLALAYITLSRIQLALGNRTEAAGSIEKAVQLLQTCGVFSEARSVVETAQVKMWLVNGERSAINRWAVSLENRFGSPAPFRYEDELIHITKARVLIAQDKPEEAIHLLACLSESAQSGGRRGRLIEIMILKALALQAAGDTTQAGLALTQSLTLAEPGGFVRVFLDEGKPMRVLLSHWLAQPVAGTLRGYATHLLAQCESELHMAAQEKVFSSDELIETLTPREMEVLHLIALGKTNPAIAQQLVVARGTIKAHTASIYRKLEAANRTEAVARARDLGLLP